MANIAILGSGAFGTALSILCHRVGHTVKVWSRSPAVFLEEEGQRFHKKLPGISVPWEVEFSTELSCVEGCELLILAVPSFAIRENCRNVRGRINKDTVLLCAAKGLEKGSFKDFVTVIEEELPENPCVALSGPSFAAEIAKGIPTTVVAASRNREASNKVQDLLMDKTLRIYVSDDVIGVELGGALKNSIAVCSGICDGLLDNAANAKAALMTRGITEIARLGVALGGRQETFAGLSGIGDLMLTCSSSQSRNYRFGQLLSQGLQVQEAMDSIGMVVEGYYVTGTAYELAQSMNVEMPIVTQAYEVLYKGKDPKQALQDLMGRPKRHESEEIWLQTTKQKL
ncbi:MAG: NAD(P)-dependent glycerol-3-phosphate dehydrogenase [Oscillospiraceae bacterium]|nr:NAD(P)-dependent glycerol-3-phosphate dehydrogenase [Oscillospiraceae bacterium]